MLSRATSLLTRKFLGVRMNENVNAIERFFKRKKRFDRTFAVFFRTVFESKFWLRKRFILSEFGVELFQFTGHKMNCRTLRLKKAPCALYQSFLVRSLLKKTFWKNNYDCESIGNFQFNWSTKNQKNSLFPWVHWSDVCLSRYRMYSKTFMLITKTITTVQTTFFGVQLLELLFLKSSAKCCEKKIFLVNDGKQICKVWRRPKPEKAGITTYTLRCRLSIWLPAKCALQVWRQTNVRNDWRQTNALANDRRQGEEEAGVWKADFRSN